MSGPREGREFSLLAPAGYYIALRVGFAFPVAEHNALPDAWVELYTQRGYMLYDPVVRWSYENSGAIRWSEIPLPDPRNVLAMAAQYGLGYGVAIACAPSGREGQRSFGSFARSDREYEDEEIEILQSKLLRLHEATAPPTNLTRAELEALSMVRDGLLLKEIANRLGVSEGAIKQRLKSAKLKLDAKTSSQAVSVAVAYGLI
ncbi:helix-turn-helix transcriptional regulator [Defluviimonas salinarum]|uniref:LuxR family transcriptional regulator n=1 Tax=Defluviimonas salinarum TaxID=2992147 RepID=A0ABT3IZH0_9RHOB|nr:LuxR family transcriptional regulator [Defluviimonas salinarum]MCW3780841.1 LuxR family transcriptional regulator [Defluviimonas salinarum]